jgi:hypothetical protein
VSFAVRSVGGVVFAVRSFGGVSFAVQSVGGVVFAVRSFLISLSFAFLSSPAWIVPNTTMHPVVPVCDPSSVGAKKTRGGRGKDKVKRAACGSTTRKSKGVKPAKLPANNYTTNHELASKNSSSDAVVVAASKKSSSGAVVVAAPTAAAVSRARASIAGKLNPSGSVPNPSVLGYFRQPPQAGAVEPVLEDQEPVMEKGPVVEPVVEDEEPVTEKGPAVEVPVDSAMEKEPLLESAMEKEPAVENELVMEKGHAVEVPVDSAMEKEPAMEKEAAVENELVMEKVDALEVPVEPVVETEPVVDKRLAVEEEIVRVEENAGDANMESNAKDLMKPAAEPQLKELPKRNDSTEVLGWSGDIQLEAIVADFDDEVARNDELTDAESSRMMYLITKELQEQLISKTTKQKTGGSGKKSKKKKSSKTRKPWLVNFLKNHGFWIRRETFPVWSKHFDFTGIVFNKHYSRDIRIWIPELEGGLACRPCCPNPVKPGIVADLSSTRSPSKMNHIVQFALLSHGSSAQVLGV